MLRENLARERFCDCRDTAQAAQQEACRQRESDNDCEGPANALQYCKVILSPSPRGKWQGQTIARRVEKASERCLLFPYAARQQIFPFAVDLLARYVDSVAFGVPDKALRIRT